MKIVYLTILIFFSFPSENDKEKFSWSEERLLTWEDFQGVPNKSDDYVASTNSGLSFSFSYKHDASGKGKLTYKVKSNFYPKLSWYRPGRVSDYILKHEQTHFDISELHARKLRRELSRLKYSDNYKEIAQAIYQNMEQERRTMQQRFDDETEHSNIVEAEYQWEEYVANQLKVYNEWK